ncbi:hypothetical protein CYMTET_10436 [Cymbomonas tetramitiformis]|uniref:Uncharacterized protein n=1 Tax=Cymbomonas tetramitiformis TaxID=36881 RepID=A0AAE0GPL5_9CHLO|nr:hypothetical protein CYMTET_10436 [Cymbomonas tetramitiformis]
MEKWFGRDASTAQIRLSHQHILETPPTSAAILPMVIALTRRPFVRPLSIGESDSELKAFFDLIFHGGYAPPTYKLVVQNILKLSDEGRQNVRQQLRELLAEGILPSIAGDIWSEGGIALLGILVYWVDCEMNLHEKLLGAIPFSDVRHTGYEIGEATKVCCADMGVGVYTDSTKDCVEDTVKDSVHCTVSDSASNIVNGWNTFDGHECNDHLLALCVHAYLDTPGVKEVFRKLRGMTTHFNHSQAIQMYDVEHTVKAGNAMDNPDGSKYGDHKQATHHATICLELPVIGRLLHSLNVDTAVKWEVKLSLSGPTWLSTPVRTCTTQ